MKKEKNVQLDSSYENLKKKSQLLEIWKRLMKNRLAIAGLIIVILFILMAIFANTIAPYDYGEQNPTIRLQLPSREHWMGTDQYGRDILSRVIYGGRISLLVSLEGTVISLFFGVFLGALSGYYSGALDTVIMRFMDVLMAVPPTLLAVCISAMLGTGTWQTALAIAISGIAPAARMIRATVLSIREQEFVEAAVAAGSRDLRIIFRHVVPNCLAPLIVDTTLRLGSNILLISSLSFIGLGVQPPIPEWGAIINSGRQYIREFYPLITFPGLFIMLTMFGFNVLGDGIRDAMDPRLKQ